MDLMEYQAKELFAKHGVPVTVGTVITTPEEAEAAAEAEGGRVVVKAQVKTGGRGKAGGVKLAQDPQEAVAQGARDPRHGHQGPHGAPGADRAGAPTSRRSTTSPSCSTGPTATTSASPPSRAASRSRQLAAREPRRHRPGLDRPAGRRRRGQGRARSSRPTGFDAAIADQAADAIKKLWNVFVEEDATLVEVNPLVKLGDGSLEALDGKVTLDDNADFRHPDHAALRGHRGRADPLEARGQGEGPQLRQARRRGRHHRQRRRAWSCRPSTSSRTPVRSTAASKPANFLDIGGGATAEVMANGLDIILGDAAGEVGLRQRLRRHHRLRRGRQRHRRRPRSCSATRRTSRSSYASTATTSRRAAGSSTRRNHPLVTLVDTMDGAADKAAELAQRS